jgi:PAS domain S-box-containing protein
MTADNGVRRVRFIWADIDLTKVEQDQKKDAVFAAGGFLTCILLLAFFFQDYYLKVRQQKAVLKNVSRVMEDAQTPFAWTNENNEFVSANRAFITLLGYNGFLDLSVKDNGSKRKFRELFALPSRQAYDEILRRSQKGEETDEYEADMITKGGGKIHVTVHGETVHVPSLAFSPMPHRFGVILRYAAS